MARIITKDGFVTAGRSDELVVDGFVGMSLLRGDLLATHIESTTTVSIDRLSAFMDFDEMTTVHVDELSNLNSRAMAIFNLITGKIYSRIYPSQDDSSTYAIRFLESIFTAKDADFLIEVTEEDAAVLTVLRGEGLLSLSTGNQPFSFVVQAGQSVLVDGDTITVHSIRQNQSSEFAKRKITEGYDQSLFREYYLTGSDPHENDTPWIFDSAKEHTMRVTVQNESGEPIQGAVLTVGKQWGITRSDGSLTMVFVTGDYSLAVTKQGYISQEIPLVLSNGSSVVYVTMIQEGRDE